MTPRCARTAGTIRSSSYLPALCHSHLHPDPQRGGQGHGRTSDLRFSLLRTLLISLLMWFLWELWTERAVTWPCVQQYGADKRAVLWLPNGIIMNSCHKWTDPKLIQSTISGCDVIFKTIMVYVGGEGMTWTRGLLFFWINGSSHCCSLLFRAASLSHSIRYLCYKCSDGMHVL